LRATPQPQTLDKTHYLLHTVDTPLSCRAPSPLPWESMAMADAWWPHRPPPTSSTAGYHKNRQPLRRQEAITTESTATTCLARKSHEACDALNQCARLKHCSWPASGWISLCMWGWVVLGWWDASSYSGSTQGRGRGES